MLETLSVKNFAIIEDLTINFKEGFTVLTGQTGAGKSLIIDTISLLLGQRADTDMIRYGANKATVFGIFSYQNSLVDKYLTDNNLPILDKLEVLREISNGKNVVKVNNVSVTLQMLKELMTNICDIHSQADTFRLINPNTYLSLLDPTNDKKFNTLLNDYIVKRGEYLLSLKTYNEIKNRSKESLEKLEFNKFAYDELSKYDLEIDEDIKVKDEILKLSNFDKIFSSLKESYNFLDNEYQNIDNIYDSFKSLSKVSEFDPLYEDNASKLEEIYYTLDDIKKDIKKSLENLDFNPDELERLQKRDSDLSDLKLKYHKSLNDLIIYKDKLKLEIDMVENYDKVLNDNLNIVKTKFNETLDNALKLSNYRKELSLKVSKEVEKECASLELEHTKFEIKFQNVDTSNILNKDIFLENGIDTLDFLISLNLGEPLKPLSKVASGGEMSRIMLAFKSYFSRNSKLSLMVFDEIDTGVSGSVALEIANKMNEISKRCQVLAITHLPQVAAKALNQDYIYKEEIDGRTVTRIKELDDEERVIHIAKMMSGDKLSEASIEAARELLKK